MKSNSCAYILSLFPIFCAEKIHQFDSFTKEHSSYLYLTLILNHKEILDRISDEVSYVYCFASEDKNYLPEELSDLKPNIYWQNLTSKNILDELENKFFKNCKNNLIIFLNSIGFSEKDLLKTLNLLSLEDDSIILGKTNKFKLSFLGFNQLGVQDFKKVTLNNLDFDTLLSGTTCNENFIHVLGNYMLIKDKTDFKDLYKELSKKESYEYCSEKIHQRFTNLFIEYKDFVK
jgi:hypothetical protein